MSNIANIKLGTEQVRPELKWEPGANTVAYYPLTDNFNDYSGNGKNLSNSGSPTITTIDGIKCAYYNGSSYSRNTSISAPIANRTIACFFKTTQTSSRILGVGSLPSSYGDYGISGLQIGIGARVVGNLGFDNTQGPNGQSDTYSFDNSKFICVVMAQSGSNCDFYINGEYKTTYTNLTTTGTSASGTMVVVGAKANYNYSEKLTGYVGSCVIENKKRSNAEVELYFKTFKSNYGL